MADDEREAEPAYSQITDLAPGIAMGPIKVSDSEYRCPPTFCFRYNKNGAVYTKDVAFPDGTRYRMTFRDGILLSVDDMPPAEPGRPAEDPAPPPPQSGYTTHPTVINPASEATATATITNGAITGITITSPSPSYTDWLARANSPDREPNNSRCPKLGTRWVSADGSAWCRPVGWQGGYVWVECSWGTQLWAYDEFWSWAEETRSTAEPAPPGTWHDRPGLL